MLQVGEDKVPKVTMEMAEGSRDLIALEMVETVDSIEELINFMYNDLVQVPDPGMLEVEYVRWISTVLD